MMQDFPFHRRAYRHEFERVAARREGEAWQRREARKRETDRESENGSADEDLAGLAIVAMASADDIAALGEDITRYKVATTDALMENERVLLQARKRLQKMLDRAYVLPDGRRVFKSEDGVHVYDEFGNEVSPKEVDPNEIADHLPKAEEYKAGVEAVEQAEAEREALLAYDAKLDEAQERLDAGELTQAEFDQIAKDLLAEMPESVRAKVGAEQEPESGAEATSNETDLFEMPSDMIMSVHSPKGPTTPGFG